jgi:NADH:ubiquinone oxidoreductase subunit B-like Fe-S oxidoreductase
MSFGLACCVFEFFATAAARWDFGQWGSDIALIIALAYVIQIQTSAWCNKFVDRCFGAQEAVEAPALAPEQA